MSDKPEPASEPPTSDPADGAEPTHAGTGAWVTRQRRRYDESELPPDLLDALRDLPDGHPADSGTGAPATDVAVEPPPHHLGQVQPGPRAGEYRIVTRGSQFLMTDHDWAAGVLSVVALAAAHGAWPNAVSVFDAGRALHRSVANSAQLQAELNERVSPDADWIEALREMALEELMRGWRAAATEGGPVNRDDNGTDDDLPKDGGYPLLELREDSSPAANRLRAVATGRMWWRTGDDRWTDGITVGAWPEVSAQQGLMYAVS